MKILDALDIANTIRDGGYLVTLEIRGKEHWQMSALIRNTACVQLAVREAVNRMLEGVEMASRSLKVVDL